MQIPYIIFSTILGLIIGSFLNALVYRLGQEEKGLTTGRSMCPQCKHTLYAKDLVPLLSYLMLKGKCRYCGKHISAHYPLVELVTALSFGVLAYFWWSNPLALGIYCVVTAGLIAISSFDIQYQLIPYKVSWTLIVVSVLAIPLLELPWIDHLVGLILLGGFLYSISKMKIRGQQAGGEGDAEIGMIMGGLLGWKVGLLSLFFSYILGAVYSLVLLLISTKKGMGSPISFGPFLAIGIYIGIISGEHLLTLYLKLIGWY